MKAKKHLDVRIPLWWPSLPGNLRAWLPGRGNVLFVVIVLGALMWAQSASAFPIAAPAAPTTSTGTIAYQGRLADASGVPLTGTYSMIFRIYNIATGGSPLWTEQWTGPNSVQVSDGLFNVMLGSMTSITQTMITSNNNLWLGITVGTDGEMLPRVQLGSVPFAVQALTVPDGSITTAKIVNGAVGTSEISDQSITPAKLNFPFFRLLGQKTCDNCGDTTESNLSGWVPVKGASNQDIIEVTVAISGTPIVVQITGRSRSDLAVTRWCAIAVYQGGTQIRSIHLDGNQVPSADYGCSGSYLFSDLPAGTYTFRAMGWFFPATNATWSFHRQIVVYEY